MKDNKEIILLIVGIFILFGLAYKPLKENAIKQKLAADSPAVQPSAISGTSTTQPSKAEVSESIRQAESEIAKIQMDLGKIVDASKRSPYYGKVSMSNIVNRNNPDPSKEYVRLSINLKTGERIKITGWYLQSEVTGYFAVIGKASLLPFPFTHTENDIMLENGDRVILTKGFSPIGISFRTNQCTGYFEEDRTFYPSLSLQCPKPIDENLPNFSSVYDRNDECLDLIKKIPRCTTRDSEYIRDLPDTVSSACKTYIKTQVNYNTCVARHFDDADFPGHEYRVYLNKFGPLWKKEREKINLRDQNGLVVDTISY